MRRRDALIDVPIVFTYVDDAKRWITRVNPLQTRTAMSPRATGRIVRRGDALLLTTVAVASTLMDPHGGGVIEAQLLVLALFLAI